MPIALKRIENHPDYSISTDGRVYSWKSKRWIKGTINDRGYRKVELNRKNYSVHRLVAIAFIPNPENKREVDHINKVRLDNRVSNLQWLTRREHAKKDLAGRKLTEEQKKHLSKINTGRKLSKETKEKISKVHKGSNHHRYNHTTYRWIHVSGKTEELTYHDFRKKYEIGSSNLSKLMTGKSKTCKGWKLG